jgi:hypothetical protein
VTHHHLVYDDDVNLLGDNIDTVKKSTKTLIDVSKEVGLEINIEKIKYMLLSHHQIIGQNREIKNSKQIFFQKVPQYLETTVPMKI